MDTDREGRRARLSPLAFKVTQEKGTEPPFQNADWDNHEEGLYVDVISGIPLFSSRDKFDSDCGWPSFSQPIGSGRIGRHVNLSHGMVHTEVTSTATEAHLGTSSAMGRERGGPSLLHKLRGAAVRTQGPDGRRRVRGVPAPLGRIGLGRKGSRYPIRVVRAPKLAKRATETCADRVAGPSLGCRAPLRGHPGSSCLRSRPLISY